MTAIKDVSHTPDGVDILPRNIKFDIEDALSRDWVGNDPFYTAVFNALSISFPTGEKNFIDTVRDFEHVITDEKLKKEIQGFYQQEGIHSREHRKYNIMLARQRGYDLANLEQVYIDQVKKYREGDKIPKIAQLAGTVAMEHVTARLAELILTDKLLENSEAPLRKLWQWHAVEEIEHKSVAMDVFTAAGGTAKTRRMVMRASVILLIRNVLKVTFRILRHDKQLWKWQTLKSFCHCFFAKDGMVRMFGGAYKDYFREDFHPWDDDNRDLLDQSLEMLELKKAA